MCVSAMRLTWPCFTGPEWLELPDDQWAESFDQAFWDWSRYYDGELGEVDVYPKPTPNDTGFVRGVMLVQIRPSAHLQPRHRERLEDVVYDLLRSVMPGTWTVDFDTAFTPRKEARATLSR